MLLQQHDQLRNATGCVFCLDKLMHRPGYLYTNQFVAFIFRTYTSQVVRLRRSFKHTYRNKSLKNRKRMSAKQLFL